MTLLPTDYLLLQKETGIGLRAIWTLAQRWIEYGDPEAHAGPKR